MIEVQIMLQIRDHFPQTPASLLLRQQPSKCGPGAAVSTTYEHLLEMQILDLLLREKLQGWGPEICISISLAGESDAC